MTVVKEMIKERVRRAQVHDYVQKKPAEPVLVGCQFKEHPWERT